MRKKLTDNKKQGAGGGSAIFPETTTAQRGRRKLFIFCLFFYITEVKNKGWDGTAVTTVQLFNSTGRRKRYTRREKMGRRMRKRVTRRMK